MSDGYVRDEEFERYTRMQNGKMDRILDNQEEGFRLAREQAQRTAELVVMVTEHTGQIAAINERLGSIEQCVNAHDSSLRLPGRVWRLVFSAVSITSLIIGIILAVRVL